MSTLQVMSPAQSPIYFGTLKLDPSEPVASNYGGFDRFVTMTCGEYGEHRVWYKAGTIMDYLQAGDTVMLEFKNNKFKIAKQQPPELVALLKGRAPQNGVAHLPSAAPRPQNPSAATTAQAPAEVDLMVSIFSGLRRELPMVSDDIVAKLACTVFIQLSK